MKTHLEPGKLSLEVYLKMNEDNFAKWERILIRMGGMILLGILITKIIAAEMGIQIFP